MCTKCKIKKPDGNSKKNQLSRLTGVFIESMGKILFTNTEFLMRTQLMCYSIIIASDYAIKENKRNQFNLSLSEWYNNFADKDSYNMPTLIKESMSEWLRKFNIPALSSLTTVIENRDLAKAIFNVSLRAARDEYNDPNYQCVVCSLIQ